jgi:hypothetical protein
MREDAEVSHHITSIMRIIFRVEWRGVEWSEVPLLVDVDDGSRSYRNLILGTVPGPSFPEGRLKRPSSASIRGISHRMIDLHDEPAPFLSQFPCAPQGVATAPKIWKGSTPLRASDLAIHHLSSSPAFISVSLYE